MDDAEGERSQAQSAYPEIQATGPDPSLLRFPSAAQYVVNASSEADDVPDDNHHEGGSARKRRRIFQEEYSDSDDQEYVPEGDYLQGEVTDEEDDDDDYDDDDDGNGYYVDDSGMTFRRPGHGQLSQPSSSIGGRGGKGIKRGPRKPMEPSTEFKQLHTDATLAFIDSDHERAITLVKQAINLNPEIFAAHSLLSEIFLAQGQREKALAALFSGAHTRPKDPGVWMQVAKFIGERSGDDRTAALQDMIYCYSRVIEIELDNHDARFQRAAANRELRLDGKAAYDYERLLKKMPHNTEVLRALAETYIDLPDVNRAVELYDAAIAHYTALTPEEAPEFAWSDVNIYTDLYSYRKDYKQGILALRSLARWLLGRKDDTDWDLVQDDDREWDGEDSPRRTQTPWFIPGQYPLESYGYGLPLELRIKMGIFRLRLSPMYKHEALYHLEWLEPDNTSQSGKLFDYGDLFKEAADALKEFGLHAEALRFYVALQYNPEYADTNLYMDMGDCYATCGNNEEAESCYLTVVEYDPQNVEARTNLAKYYESINMLDQALKFITEAAELGRAEAMPSKRRGYVNRVGALAEEYREAEAEGNVRESDGAARTGEAVSLIDKYRDIEADTSHETSTANVQYLYGKMQELQPAMRAKEEDAVEAWLDIADAMTREFRSNRIFFPLQRKMAFLGYSREARKKAGRLTETPLDEILNMTERLQNTLGTTTTEAKTESVPTDYCGLSFDVWLDIFLEYALVLSDEGHGEESYDVLAAAADASVWYHSKTSSTQIYVCWLTCAIRLNDEESLTNISRWFMKEYQFITDAYRLFTTLCHLSGNPRKSLFHNAANIKFILRQVKAVDYTLPPDPAALNRPPYPGQERAALTTKDEHGNPIAAEEMDVALLVLYGHILYSGTSFTNALNYFFRAYALEPKNPAVLLSIALCYIHHALKRQAENRNYMIMQGLAFMEEYRAVREKSSVLQERQEMEFNFARVHHMLGLAHLAIQGYEKCLLLGEEIYQRRENREKPGDGGCGVYLEEDFTREAAYALQCLYAVSGEVEVARRITERWLVI